MNWPSAFWWYSHTILIISSRETKLWETTTSRTCRLSGVSGHNSHEMRWEGRNFEVISTDLLWTGYEAGKIWAILSESHDATCHQHGGSTCGHCFPPNGLITYLHICHTFLSFRVGHFKVATIKWFAYIWKSTSILEALAPGQAEKIYLVTVLNASLVVVLV